MNGAIAPDLIVKVPLGTVITDLETNFILGDLTKKDSRVVVAYGGRGGRGNMAFVTRNNPAPDFAENGEPGEEKKLKIELKLLADVGLVGMPSVGKSTIISKISAAKPKIVAYHFTTLHPNLGVTRTKDGRSFVVADLPGLIEGASLGEGLGDKFLKHIERTRVIAHVIDMSGFEGRPIYVWTEEQIKAHFLICFIALTIIRIIQYKILKYENKSTLNVDGWEQGITAEKIKEALNNFRADSIYLDYYKITEINEEIEKILKSNGIDFKFEKYNMQEIKTLRTMLNNVGI